MQKKSSNLNQAQKNDNKLSIKDNEKNKKETYLKMLIKSIIEKT